MTVRWETTQVDGKTMRIYLGIPERPGPHLGMVVAQHAPGVDGVIEDMVHRLRREGYVAAAPDFFHRLPPDATKRTRLLRDDEIIADLKATIAHLKTLQLTIASLGIAGFGMGGGVSYLAATAISDFKAAAVFYGGSIMKTRGDTPSPFERSANIECPIIGFFGVEDTNPSPEDVRNIDAELARLDKWHEFHSYLDTGHGFHNFFSEKRYRERAARASWREMLEFFREHLRAAR